MSWRISALLFIACILVTFPGCSKTPVPASHVFSTQKTMQSAHHWDVLAEDVATRVEDTLAQKNGLYGHRLYVDTQKRTPFHTGFRRLLLGYLLKQPRIGIVKKDNAMCHLKIEAQVVEHASGYTVHPPWKLTALGSGVFAARRMAEWSSNHVWATLPALGFLGDLFLSSGMYGVNLNTEVIITTMLWHDQELVDSSADIYYIHRPDRKHYEQSLSRYQLVSKDF